MNLISTRLASAAIVLAFVLLLAGVGVAQDEAAPSKDERMEWWREARFGLFIHWGLYAIPAGEWKGQTNHAEWIRETAQIPIEEYDKFVGQFNPVKFDADAWARVAKDAGMKYIVITSKHHDGFCLFDSKYTDYDVMSTPFKRDILKELSDACRRHGLKMCFYHSIMDWHHPGYLPRRSWETRSAEGADFGRYVQHLRNQVTELLTNYGEIGVMWFDGQWESTWTHEYGQPLYDLCLKLQPTVIVNNRVDKGGGEGAGFAGDFGTPEQYIPDTGLPGVDWETCMTMNRHWGYNKNDHDWKSSRDLIRMLVDIASKGGNYLLNIGPTAEGTFPEPCVERLRDIGRWMKVNGDAIYGTSASPLGGLAWGRCTAKTEAGKTTLYLHVFDWPKDGKLRLEGVGNAVIGARLLAKPSAALAARRDESDIVIDLPVAAPDQICSVVALEIEGKPVVYGPPEIIAETDVLVRPIEVQIAAPEGLEVRYTVDGATPTAQSSLYSAPVRISDTTTLKARAFHRGKAVSGVAETTFTKVQPRLPAQATGLVRGVTCGTYKGDWNRLPDFGKLKPEKTETVADFRLPPGAAVEYVGRKYTAYIDIPRDDVYVFALTSDDGARLTVGDKVVVDNDGLHVAEEKRGAIALAAGLHIITVEYFNKTGSQALEVRYAPVGEELQEIPADMLRCRAR
jgi:alpha-L-fucosidase